MKKDLLIMGILFIIMGILSLAVGGLYGYIGTHTLDASFDFYETKRKMKRLFLILGAALLIAGIICLIMRRKG